MPGTQRKRKTAKPPVAPKVARPGAGWFPLRQAAEILGISDEAFRRHVRGAEWWSAEWEQADRRSRVWIHLPPLIQAREARAVARAARGAETAAERRRAEREELRIRGERLKVEKGELALAREQRRYVPVEDVQQLLETNAALVRGAVEQIRLLPASAPPGRAAELLEERLGELEAGLELAETAES